MGEAYRARDTKLERDVAVKVLPEAAAQNPERLARFEREAKVLASLNHPNIAQIYGIEGQALIMELVPRWPVFDFQPAGPESVGPLGIAAGVRPKACPPSSERVQQDAGPVFARRAMAGLYPRSNPDALRSM